MFAEPLPQQVEFSLLSVVTATFTNTTITKKTKTTLGDAAGGYRGTAAL
jgi:hypothetical protein